LDGLLGRVLGLERLMDMRMEVERLEEGDDMRRQFDILGVEFLRG
jgi:hypothetical protein